MTIPVDHHVVVVPLRVSPGCGYPYTPVMDGLALDILGYAGSLLVVLSLSMTSVVRLRVISLAGSFTFLVYGLLIDALPIVLTNGIIVVLNIVFLTRLFTRVEEFDVVEVAANSKFLERFLEYYSDDVAKAWPGYRYQPVEEHLRLVVFRDLVPAGVFIAEVDGGTANVQIDYAAPNYADLKNARTLFGPGHDVLVAHGISQVVSSADSALHRKFLLRLGFEETERGYVYDLEPGLS